MNYKIKLNDKYVTEFVALPISIQKTVDESLDQANIRLVFTDIAEPIKPLSNIDIEFWNDTQSEIKKTYSFFVSNDNVTHNIASGTHNHELALIELTKWLERFTNIVKCNTRPLIHDYNALNRKVYFTRTDRDVSDDALTDTDTGATSSYNSPQTPKELTLLSAFDFATANSGSTYPQQYKDYSTKVYENGTLIYTGELNDIPKITLQSGKSYLIEYKLLLSSLSRSYTTFEMYIDCIAEDKAENKSVARVVELLLKNFETLKLNQAPRFALEPNFIEKYKELDAPEINMQGTLFECLSQIGDFIHAIPRLRKRTSFDSTITNPAKYIVTFDELGAEDYAVGDLSDFIGHTQSFSIEQYATTLDSNIDNLINTDNVGEGTLVEPNLVGWKTPRTDISTVEVTTENCFIETSEAIEQIIKVEAGYIGNDYIGDITPFIYSKTEYDGQLSSISDNYPLSKGFALYYQQGAKNIYGLSFKLPNAISPVFSNYAIFNIIKQKTGKDYSSTDLRDLQFRVTYVPNTNGRVKQQKTELQDGLPSSINFNQNASKITSNLFGEAIKGALAKLGNPEITKSYILTDVNQIPKEGQKFDDDYYISVIRTENYNDLIRCDLGLSKNYNRKDKYMALNSQIRFYEVSEIQAVDRQLYYEDYCIIGEDVEYNDQTIYQNFSPTLTTLQQGYNFIPIEAVGETITFILRQGLSQTRFDVNTNNLPFVYNDNLTIGFISYPDKVAVYFTGETETQIGVQTVKAEIESPLITKDGLQVFASSFDNNKEPVTLDAVYCKTFSNETNYGSFTMPLTTLSIGNGLFFHYEFIDNFTAGARRSEVEGIENNKFVKLKLQYQESYTNNFGEFDYMSFNIGQKIFMPDSEINNQEKAVEYGNNLPKEGYGALTITYFKADGNSAINVNKDSSEVIAMNYQVNFVTNSDIIIGADVAKSSIFLAKEPLNYKLYLLPNRIRKYENDVDLTGAKEIGAVQYEVKPNGTDKMQIKLQDVQVGNISGESWVICNGNKLIFGKNGRIAPNTILTLPFLTFKHII